MDFMTGTRPRAFLSLVAPVLLAACGSGSPAAGSSNAAVESSKGAALPEGLALMPGAKVTGTDAPGGGAEGAPTSQVRFEVVAASADIAKFYKAEFARLGLAVENDMTVQGSMILTGKAHNGEDIVINATDGTGGAPTEVTVSTAKATG